MRTLRMLALAVVVGGIYALGALLTFWYFSAPETGVAFFPPAGLTLATLLLTRRRTWPLWLAAFAVAEIWIDLAHGQTLFMAVGFATANVVEPLIGASLFLVGMKRQGSAPRRDLLRYIVCAVVIGPIVGATIGGLVTVIAGTGAFASTAAKWWLGDALGVLVVATPILAWKRRDFYPTRAGLPETIGIALVAVALTVIPSIHYDASFTYMVAGVLMLAALRGGPFGVGVSGFAVGFAASWVVATGHAHALLTLAAPQDALVDTQLFIGVTILAALTLAVEVAERTRIEHALAGAETARVQAEFAASRAAAAERSRIALETHDIVGHALNVMILCGAAARRVLDTDSSEAKRLLATVEDVGRDAFRDLDFALGLADQSTDFVPLQGLADLDQLVERLARAGMQVDYEIEGSPRPLPRLVDGSAFRIIQESLTNVAKHAADATTHVHVRFAPAALELEVSDGGGRSEFPKNGGGRGSVGMRERVAVLGGYIEAGPTAGGGYSVTAELPLEPV
jgi:signal transduction histidine kinase